MGISYTGIWAQSLISATSFLILINVNKFAIIGIEAVFMDKQLTMAQIVGAVITIIAGVSYGKAQEALTATKDPEKEPLVKKETAWDLRHPEPSRSIAGRKFWSWITNVVTTRGKKGAIHVIGPDH